MAQTQKNVKPPYGPLMMRDIFASNWMDKLNDLVERQYQVPVPLAMCVLAVAGFHHVVHFHAQAYQHSFTAGDFPHPICPPNSKVWKGNPFMTIAQVTVVTDVKLKRFKAIKTQGDEFCGLRWRPIPEKIRRELNEVFVELEESEEAGAWNVLEEPRKKVAETLRESEAESKVLTGTS